MNKIKRFFEDFPRNIQRGEKEAVIFTAILSLLVVACLFAAVVFVPKLFPSRAANAGGEGITESSTADPDLRYDYILVDPPTEEETEETSEEETSETEETTEMPTVKVEKPVANDPESKQKPKDDPGPVITVPTPEPPPDVPPVTPPEPPDNGGSDNEEPPVISDFNYFVTGSLNGMQNLGGFKYYFRNGQTLSSGIYNLDGLRYRINQYGAISSKMGIDISEFNGTVNWQVAKNAGIDFAILRCAYRGYGSAGNMKEDGMLDKNIRSAKAAGMPVGLYFFSQAVNAEEGAEEGRAAVQYARKYGVQLPLYIDTEESTHPSGDGRADHISRAARTAAVKAFCDTVRSAGYKAGIYASASWFMDKLDFSQLRNNEIWIANYNSGVSPDYNGFSCDWKTWQYSSKLVIPGLQTGINTVDINISLYDYVNGSNMSSLGSNNILLGSQAEVDVYLDAENWVAKAEESGSVQDHATALEKVNALFDHRVKNVLLARLDKIDISA